MVAALPDLILALPPAVALLIVFLFPALEASAFVGFIFPGEIAVILGGVLASQGRFPLGAAIVAAVLGAAIGDSIGYAVGKRWGERIVHGTLRRLPIVHRELDKHLATANEYVRRRGPHAVFVGRFTLALRVLVPGLAGMAELPYPTFLLFNALGAVIWGTTFVVLGFLAGTAWERVAADASHVGLVLLVVVLVGLVGVRILRSVREHRVVIADRLAALPPVRWFRTTYPRASAWLARRVDPSSPRGFPLSVAVVGCVLAAWLFGALTQDVVGHDDAALRDPAVTSWVVAHRVVWLTDVMRAVTWLGSKAVLIPLVVAVGLFFFLRSRAVGPTIQLCAALGASFMLYTVVKGLVGRARPPMVDRLVDASGPSFPSGHSADAAAVFGTLALILIASAGRRARAAIWVGAVLVSVLVAVSRLYLGVHWFTDASAGLALGWAIVAAVAAVTLSIPPRASARPPSATPSLPPSDTPSLPPDRVPVHDACRGKVQRA